MKKSVWLVCGLLAGWSFGCESAPADGQGGSGGSDAGGAGEGGAGGEVGAGGSAKPTCQSPDAPTGPTPLPRADPAGALSPDGKAFLMFGGDTATVICGQTPSREHVGDTWVLDTACGGWTEITSPGPSARARHAVATDPARNRALLFGGRTRMGNSGPYELFNDVWAFDFAAQTWTAVATTGTGPSARSNAAAEVVGDKLLVFGGSTSTSGLSFTPQNDVYVLDLLTNVWEMRSPAGDLPEARLFHAMTRHPSAPKVFVHSGGDANAFTGPFLLDLWSYDLDANAWAPLAQTTNDGLGRIKFGLFAFTPEGAAGPTVGAFGGHDDGSLGNRNDVAWFDTTAAAAAWSTKIAGDTYNNPPAAQCDFAPDFTIIDMASPERRSAFATGTLPDGSALVVFGGDSDCGRLSDAHWFDARAGVWTPIRTTLPGLSCLRTGSTTCSSLCN